MKPIFDRESFLQGVGFAVARLVELHDQPTMAAEIIRESGYAYGDFAAVCDEADLPYIKKAWDLDV